MLHRTALGVLLPLTLLATDLSAPRGLSAQAPARADTTAAKAPSKEPLPLETGRTLEFTTTRGSWISLDVSPDGQTIVFDLLGDLYTMPISGGTATQLTSGMAYDAQPRFSPDGRRVVFVSDRSGGDNLWILSLDGRDTVQVTKGNDNLYHSPVWAPDGRYVVASRSGGLGGAAKLWIFHAEGGTGAQLIREPAPLKTLGAAFTPDGRYIWLAQRMGDWQYNAMLPQYQLAVYDRETGTRTVMSARHGSAFRPAVSPDGRWLVYGSRHQTETGLRIRDLQSGAEEWLAYPIQRDDQESRASLDVLPGFAFTPDSRAVIISYGGEIWRVPVDKSAATRIPMQVNVALQLGPEVRFENSISDEPTFNARQIRDLTPSPDGRRLAFTALDRVYVMELPDGTPRRLTSLEVGEFFPTWSPDGRWLSFTSWHDAQGGHIWRMSADGRSRPQQLTRVAALYWRPAISSDGRRVLAVRSAARNMQELVGPMGAEFVWVPATGGELSVIGPTAGRDYPHFVAGEPERIFASSMNEGLVSFRWDGTDVKNIVKVTGPTPPPMMVTEPHDVHGGHGLHGIHRMPTHPGHGDLEANPTPRSAFFVKMAPRGDRALAQFGNDIYVVTVPRVGGQTPTINISNVENAAFPARKLTDIGGYFPTWSADGNTVHWAVGNAHVAYDLERARVVEDSLKAARRAEAAQKAAAAADSTKQETEQASGDAPADSVQAPTAAAAPEAPRPAPGYKPEERRITVTVQRDLPRGSAVLRGARVITMRGDEVIEDADLVIRDNRIAAVGRRGEVEVPQDARVVDVAGKTIVPGFVDTHYHAQWLFPEVHTTQVWQYLTNLAYGVTTTRDPQTGTTDILTYGDLVESGQMIGPRIYSTGPGVFTLWQPIGDDIKSLEDARRVLRRYAEYYDTKTIKMYMTGNRQQRQWIIMAARELGLMPTTEGGLDYKLNLTHAIDGYSGLEHSLPIAPLFDDVLELFRGSQITYSPTLLVSYGGPWGENFYYTTENVYGDEKLRRFFPEPILAAKTRRQGLGSGPGPGGWFMQEEYVFPRHAEFVRRLVEAGGRAGVGSHGQLQGLGYHWELWSVAAGGMSNHDALRTATLLGAEGIGFGRELGSIEPGKLADLVILDANPLENIRNTNSVRMVMKNGRLYDGDTLEEMWPVRRPLPQQTWQSGAPATQAGIR